MKIFTDKEQNLNVYIFSNDHLPAHVHIFKGSKNEANIYNVKINIGGENERPSVVKTHESIKRSDINAALELVFEKQEIFLKEWVRIHGIQKLENQRRGTRRSNRKG
jgi:hypothetical protein